MKKTILETLQILMVGTALFCMLCGGMSWNIYFFIIAIALYLGAIWLEEKTNEKK